MIERTADQQNRPVYDIQGTRPGPQFFCYYGTMEKNTRKVSRADYYYSALQYVPASYGVAAGLAVNDGLRREHGTYFTVRAIIDIISYVHSYKTSKY